MSCGTCKCSDVGGCNAHENADELGGIDLSSIGDKPILIVRCSNRDDVHRVQEVMVNIWPSLKEKTKLEAVLVLPSSVELENLTDAELASRYRLCRIQKVRSSPIVDLSGKPVVSGIQMGRVD